jgi:hypothetical protein
MSVITEILDRLSGIEIVKERVRDTGARIEQWTSQWWRSIDRCRRSTGASCASKRSPR